MRAPRDIRGSSPQASLARRCHRGTGRLGDVTDHWAGEGAEGSRCPRAGWIEFRVVSGAETTNARPAAFRRCQRWEGEGHWILEAMRQADK
eukprot:4554440-Pyramimonas_sp.AAC.1